MVLVTSSSFAADNLNLTPGKISLKAGETADVEVVLNAAELLTYTALQIVVTLPDGVEPVPFNQAAIDLGEKIGKPVAPAYGQITMPATLDDFKKEFQVSSNAFKKGQDIYKDDANNNKVYERTTTKAELSFVLMSLSATPFPFDNHESLFKFRVRATDKCFTGDEECFDITHVTLNTAEMLGYNPADVEKAATLTYTIDYKLDDDCEYGTLCWPVALDFTANDFEAGIAALNGSSFSTTKVTKIPAATPVIIKGEKGKTYSISTTREESLDDVSANVLEGTVDEPLTVSGNNIYALANLSNGPGFYRVKSGVEIPQYKAYYTATGASVDAFIFEEYTGINKVVADDANAEVFTISGVKVDKANKKGIYIVNGKKVVVK